VVFPNLYGQPLLDNFIKEQLNKTKKIDYEEWVRVLENSLKEGEVASIPNRYLCIIPYEFGEKIAKKSKEYVSKEIQCMIDEIYGKIKENDKTNGELKKLMLKQAKNTFETNWVVLSWGGTDSSAVEEILSEYKKLTKNEERYKQIHSLIKENEGIDKDANIGIAYSLLYELTERLLGASKAVRLSKVEEHGQKCSICGIHEELGHAHARLSGVSSYGERRKESKEWWQSLRGVLKTKENERLCTVCLIKRLAREYSKIKQTFEIEPYPSTSEISATLFKRRLAEICKEDEKIREICKKIRRGLDSNDIKEEGIVPAMSRYEFPLLKYDGKWLMKSSYMLESVMEELECDEKTALNFINSITPALNELYERLDRFYGGIRPSTYYAVLMMDGDNMGRWLAGDKNPKIRDVVHPIIKVNMDN
jgi:CRISPR-associated protein Cmr2